ncbi:unnamed protein product, partial [Didymodactylos carnosus]
EVNSQFINLPINGEKGNQVLPCLDLEHLPSHTNIVFIGIHLKAKKSFSHIRKEQTETILKFLHTHYSTSKNIIIAGDFNGEPSEDFYQILTYDKFSSAYKILLGNGRNEPEFTTWKFRPNDEQCHTIDYIFYKSTNILQPLAYLTLPTKKEIGENGLPSEQYPSDHLALGIKFSVKSKYLDE